MKKCFAVLLCLAVFFSCVGCASQSASSAPGADAPAASTPAADDGGAGSVAGGEPVTLRFMWWGGDERHEATLEAIELYMDKYPNVTIEAEYQGYDGYRDKLTTQLAGGTTADIVQFDFLWRAELASQFVDFNDYADIVDLTQFEMESFEEYGVVDGKFFGIPTGVGPFTFTIHQSLVDKFGLDISNPWTWEDMFTENQKIQAIDPESYMTWKNAEYEMFFRAYLDQLTGKQLVNEDYTLGVTREELTEAYTFVRRCYDERVFQPPEETAAYETMTQNPKWLNGQIVADWEWASSIEVNYADKIDDAVALMFPVMDGAKDSGIQCPVSQLLCVPESSPNKEAAMHFINAFLNDPDLVKALRTVRSLPSSKIALQTLADAGLIKPAVQNAVDLSLSNPGMVHTTLSENEELTEIALDVHEQLKYGRLNPEQAAEELATRFEDKLAELQLAA